MNERKPCVLIDFCVGPTCRMAGGEYRKEFKAAVEDTKGLEGLTVVETGCRNECTKAANMDMTVNGDEAVRFKYFGDPKRGLPVDQLITTIKQNLIPPTEQ